MRKPKLIILKGLPYSGKTEWARNWANKHNRIRLSWSDTMRIYGEGFVANRKTLAFDATLRTMRQALRKGYDCVLDECNLYGAEYSLFMSQAQMNGASVEFHTMKATTQSCIERCVAAGGASEECERIARMAEKYSEWLKQ